MKLEFENSRGERRVIGYPKDKNESMQMIRDFLAGFPNFKSYYTRVFENEAGETVYDVGSHTEFFIETKN